MERYKASIESVDSALNRLNQTLASYKLLSANTSANSSASQLDLQDAPVSREPKAAAAGPTPNGRQHESNQHIGAPLTSSAVPQATQHARSQHAAPEQNVVERLMLGLRAGYQYPDHEIDDAVRLRRVQLAYGLINSNWAYCLPLYLVLAIELLGLGYPDLAAGSAYKALLLSDALDDEAEEYHEPASDALKCVIQQQPLEERIRIIRKAMDAELERAKPSELDPTLDVELTLWLNTHYRAIMYRILTRSLLLCKCLRSALSYVRQALRRYPADAELLSVRNDIYAYGARNGLKETDSLNDWPDNGYARREVYPWNEYEPARLSLIEEINMFMIDSSDCLEVKAVQLPALKGEEGGISTQLGVFAKRDIEPGEEILNETSLLTANNKLQDALCDACSGDLPALGTPEYEKTVQCAECEVVFCSEWCQNEADYAYHRAVCGKDVEAIAKDVPPTEAADSLYSLLLLRALAMGECQEVHSLEVLEVKHVWGDFSPTPDPRHLVYPDMSSPDSCTVPQTLPFSFEYNIRLPFHMLEKMDIDIFARGHEYDVWVFNTLYAKFRGTASARLSGLGGRPARGPEVSAVHPMWCLANHSCDPNVSWEWGGSIKFWARQERVTWAGKKKGKAIKSKAGIKKGEEILNHYCDVNLPVNERREWLRGALGGDCRCKRCLWEAKEDKQATSKS